MFVAVSRQQLFAFSAQHTLSHTYTIHISPPLTPREVLLVLSDLKCNTFLLLLFPRWPHSPPSHFCVSWWVRMVGEASSSDNCRKYFPQRAVFRATVATESRGGRRRKRRGKCDLTNACSCTPSLLVFWPAN